MSNRSAQKNQVTVDAIVEAAEALLADGGVAAVTLDAVSQRAEVAVQTIYNRVGGRPALLMAVAERALAANREYLDEAYAVVGTPVERVRAVAAAYVRFARERPHQYRLLAFPPADAPAPESVASLISAQNAKFTAALQDGIDQGYLRPDLDAAVTATVLWRMWDGILALLFRGDRLAVTETQLPVLLQHLETIVEQGLAHPSLR